MYVFCKVFKSSIKVLMSPFIVMFQRFFSSQSTQREIGHSKGARRAHEVHSRAMEAHGHSKGTQALGHSATQDTCALGHSKGTWILSHSDTRKLGHLRHSRHSRHFTQKTQLYVLVCMHFHFTCILQSYFIFKTI